VDADAVRVKSMQSMNAITPRMFFGIMPEVKELMRAFMLRDDMFRIASVMRDERSLSAQV
jgi:hypothetical protein